METYLYLSCLSIFVLGAFSNVVANDNQRFLFYMVNPGEGFNLRRDVFSRIAVMTKHLNQEKKYAYTLVLPEWSGLYHWQTRELGDQSKIPWKLFFDIESIRRYVPVMDFMEYYGLTGNNQIDKMFILQRFVEGWEDGKFEEKIDIRDCLDPVHLYREKDGSYVGLREYEEARVSKLQCASAQGTTSVIHNFVHENANNAKTILIDRAETLMHHRFGDEEYWSIRRATRYAKHLVSEANNFREKYLNSTDVSDKTERGAKWEDFQPPRGTPVGGPYLAVHLRRKDFVRARGGKVPTLKSAADQLERSLKENGLTTVFIATDAPEFEFDELKNYLKDYKVLRYRPSKESLRKFKDGGVSIIDQIICSHARFFLGTYESTFSFRIQEDREILGFPIENTFHILCPDGKFDCEKGSVWKIVYPQSKKSHEEL